jgi:hypothetical protein
MENKILEQLEDILMCIRKVKLKMPKCIALYYEKDDYLDIERQIIELNLCRYIGHENAAKNSNSLTIEKDGVKIELISFPFKNN